MGEPSPWLPPPSGQPPHVLAAWLDDRISDIREAHFRRVGELDSRLKAQLHAWDCAALAQACKATSAAARELRIVPPGQPHAGEEPGRFQDQFSSLCIAGTKARRLLADLSVNVRSQASGMRKVIVELELEQGEMVREAEPVIGWLYELSRSLKKEEPGQSDYLRDLGAVAQYAHSQLKSLLALNALLAKVAVCAHDVLRRLAWTRLSPASIQRRLDTL